MHTNKSTNNKRTIEDKSYDKRNVRDKGDLKDRDLEVKYIQGLR